VSRGRTFFPTGVRVGEGSANTPAHHELLSSGQSSPARREGISDRLPAFPLIRPGRDTDSTSIIALIGTCWTQYPGVRMDVDGEMPELRTLASYYAAQGGVLWVAELDGEILGMIAVRPYEANSWEICRVYVHPSRHGSGLGHHLLDIAEAHARTAGADRLALWSDTRFERAHHFYEKRSYVRSGPLRVLHDISHSLEFAYAKPINGVAVLDAAAAASAVPRLCDILSACVAEGAGVSFLPPLGADVARGFWRGIAKEVAAGIRVLLGGWVDGVLCGTVTLAFAGAENQPHRADVQKLMVHPSGRRAGLARTMMQRLEQEAMRSGRTLLTLDTRADDRAERLYRSMEWNEVGLIPGYALKPDRTPDDTRFFWKALARGDSV
jgi:GNAT superfamily N-acetyltransferase